MKLTLGVAVLLLASSAAVAGAQAAGPGVMEAMPPGGMAPWAMAPRAMAPRGDVAGFLLAHTGELKLTDQQVTRLAAIARRTADRRTALRTSMESARGQQPQFAPGARDSAGRAARGSAMAQMRATFEREREQTRADLRDALAVLTPDQLATAWEMRDGGPRTMMRGLAGE